MTLIIAGVAYGQGTPTQAKTVGVIFVEFIPEVDNPIKYTDFIGGVGYTGDQPRQIDNGKYLAQYWYNFFFQEEGHVEHPDSMTHGSGAQIVASRKWTGPYEPFHYGSVSRWMRANSYGRHQMLPMQRNETGAMDGIFNSIDANGKIEWIQLGTNKRIIDSGNAYHILPWVDDELDEIKDPFGTPYREMCDQIFVVYAGTGSMHTAIYHTSTSPGYAFFPEKTRHNDHVDDILTFYMSSAVHEYIHMTLNQDDYGYDRWVHRKHGLRDKRARWMGLSGMYMHGLQNRPYHLDPWAKLKFGWIDFEILTEGEYVDKSLPFIAQPEDGIVPKVFVIPVNVPWSINAPNWDQGHYLIIENRRRVSGGYDDNVTEENSPGGFLVWEFDERLKDTQRGGLTLVEADGNYDMKFKDSRWIYDQLASPGDFPHTVFLPTASDFWSEPAVLSTWSRHLLGMLDPTTMFNTHYAPDVVKTVPRQITIRFGEYEAVGDENVIPYISVGIPTSNISTATKNNNQSKLIKDGDKLVFVATADYSGDAEQGKITVFESLDNGQTWNDVSFMNDIDIYELPTWDPTWDPSSFTPEFQGVNPWKPAVVESGAAAPAIARIEGSWGVVWQQKVAAGESRVFFSLPSGAPVDLAGASINRYG
jgi:hypothetical protein